MVLFNYWKQNHFFGSPRTKTRGRTERRRRTQRSFSEIPLGVLRFQKASEMGPLHPEPLAVFTSACSATSAVKFFIFCGPTGRNGSHHHPGAETNSMRSFSLSRKSDRFEYEMAIPLTFIAKSGEISPWPEKKSSLFSEPILEMS